MLIELQTVLDLIERRVKEIEDTGDIRTADETLVRVNTLRMLSLSIRVHCAAPVFAVGSQVTVTKSVDMGYARPIEIGEKGIIIEAPPHYNECRGESEEGRTVRIDGRLSPIVLRLGEIALSEQQPPAPASSATFEPQYERRPLDAPDPEQPRKKYDWYPKSTDRGGDHE